MDYKNINQLLEKYWEGETSIQEEETLKQYFNNGNVAKELLPYQPLFQYFKEEQDVLISDDFEKNFLEKIKNEPEAKVKPLRWMKVIRSIAAVGIILLCSLLAYQNFNQKPVDPFAKYEVQTEKEAIEATKAALLLLSGKMKKGRKKASKGLVEVKEAKRRTFK